MTKRLTSPSVSTNSFPYRPFRRFYEATLCIVGSALLGVCIFVGSNGCKKTEQDTSAITKSQTTVEKTAQEISPPKEKQTKSKDANSVMVRYIEAIGGETALQKVNTIVSEGTFSMPAQKITADIVIRAARGDKFRSTITIPGMGVIEQGSNGTVVWEKSMMTGARILTGEERVNALHDADPQAALRFKEYYQEIRWAKEQKSSDADSNTGSNAGNDKTNTAASDKKAANTTLAIEAVTKSGKVHTKYFDKKTGLLLRVKRITSSQMGEIPVDMVMSDYRSVHGIQVAYQGTIKAMGTEQVIALTSVKINQALPEKTFALPDEITALLKTAPAPGSIPATTKKNN